MKKLKLLALITCLSIGTAWAQNDYLVKTTSQKSTSASDEEAFVEDNFPSHALCDWQPGMKFMFIGEEKYNFIPILKDYNTNRDVENGKFQHKILELVAIEETEMETYTGKNISVRFVFKTEDGKFYHEFKNQNLSDLCLNNTRVHIKGLVYLGDVDIAKELLSGLTLYIRRTSVRVDDANGSNGFREVKIAANTEVTITAVGVGTREYPVKLVFEDRDGNSYYTELAFSLTNAGLMKNDFQGARFSNCFANAFRFNDESTQSLDALKKKYVDRSLYPKRTILVSKSGATETLLRYTPLTLTDLSLKGGTMATIQLKGRNGDLYMADVDLKYDIFIKNDNYIDDMFGFGNLRTQYPYITEDNWKLITNGEVKIGMTKDECRLSLGSPVQIVANTNSKYETWYYQGKILDFEGNTLLRIK